MIDFSNSIASIFLSLLSLSVSILHFALAGFAIAASVFLLKMGISAILDSLPSNRKLRETERELKSTKEELIKCNKKLENQGEAFEEYKKAHFSEPNSNAPAPDAYLQRFGEIADDPHDLFPRFIFSEEQQANYYQSIAKNALGRIDQSNFTVKRNFLQIPTVDVQNATERNGLSNVYMTGKASLGIEIESHQEDNTTKTYVTTLTSCTCDDFLYNKHRNSDTPCKHMVFFAQKIGALYLYRDQAAKLLDGKIDELKQLAANTSPKTKKRQPTPPKKQTNYK